MRLEKKLNLLNVFLFALWFYQVEAKFPRQSFLESVPKPSAVRSSSLRTAPTITEQPENTWFTNNGFVPRLNCRADGNPRPKISWIKDGLPLVNLADRGIVEESGGLIFFRAQTDEPWTNTGVYQCLARNEVGSVLSKNASVQVSMIEDDFRLEPSDAVVAVGSFVTMECEGPRGNPEPRMSWKKNHRPLTINERMEIQSGGSLVISRLQKSDSATYECVATNEAGKVASSPALLLVQEPPRPRIEPTMKTVNVGQTVQVTCTVEGDPQARVTWSKTGGELSNRFSSSSDGFMRINGVEVEDSGEYVCTAQNRVGKQSASVRIIVQKKPVIESQNSEVIAQTGGTATLQCRATGNPKPNISWRDFNGKEMLAEKSYQNGHILVNANGDLVLFSVRQDDEGLYRCQARNSAGSATAEVRLNVEKQQSETFLPPILSQVPFNRTVQLATTLLLNCSSHSVPRPTFAWYKDGNVVQADRTTIHASGSLKITNVQYSDAGKYTCKASNRQGTTEWNAWINVKADQKDVEIDSASPRAPGKPIFVRSTSTSVSLSWSYVDLNLEIDYFVIDYYRQGSSYNTWNRISSSSHKSIHIIKQLLPSSNYVFIVRAASKYGVSDPSPLSDIIKTGDFSDVSPNNPLNSVSIRVVNSRYDVNAPGVVTLQWHSNSGCDVIDGFLITVQAATFPSASLITQQVDCSSRSAEVSHVAAGTKYEVRVRPYKEQQSAPASPIVFFSATKGIISPSPLSLSSQVDDQDQAIVFRWQPPSDLPAPYVTEYILKCRSLDGSYYRTVKMNGTVRELTLSSLPSGADIRATLAYATQLGVGTESPEVAVKMPASNDDSIASFLQTPIGIVVISVSALIFILALIIAIYCFRKSRKNCKARTHRSSRAGNSYLSPILSSDNKMRGNGDTFDLERVPIPHGNNGNAPSFHQNDESTTNINEAQGFSYVTDQLISRNNIPPQFSRTALLSQSSVPLQQSRPVILSRQQNGNIYAPSDIPLLEEGNDHPRYPLPYNPVDYQPHHVSPNATNKTGSSDRSQGSSGVRSVSDKSSRSGQSSRRPGAGRISNQGSDINNRLHGSQQNYQNVSLEENMKSNRLNPPTPPIREESYRTNDDPYNRNYENVVVPPSKITSNQGHLPKLPPMDKHHPTVMNAPWASGNGFGSETDDRESSCERQSSPTSSVDDNFFEMESVSQVGQNLHSKEKSHPYYKHPEFSYPNSDQEPLLISNSYGVPPNNNFPNTYPHQSHAEVASQFPTDNKNSSGSEHRINPVNQSGSLTSHSTGSNSSKNSRKPKIPPSKISGPMTLELASKNHFSDQNEVPESLKLDISNALNRPKNTEDPTPSSPTESRVSDLSACMSTASSCWQFQGSSPTKPYAQPNSSSAISGRLLSPTYYNSNSQKYSQRNNINSR